MLRPICLLRQQIYRNPTKDIKVRTKVVRAASILKPAEKLKLWHKENKELFGPLLETRKQKKIRTKKADKNSRDFQQNNVSKDSLDAVKTDLGSENVVRFVSCNPVQPFKILRNMWQNISVTSTFLNRIPSRGIKTLSNGKVLRSSASAAQPGYSTDDKILQIKQHQNDYAKQYPSVTLILNKTMTEESRIVLEKWKQERIAEIGEEAFQKYYETQMAVGTKLHKTLRDYFTQPRTQLRIEKDVEGVWNSVAEVLKHISSPKAIESNVVHPVLKYRGIFDAIADYEDKPTLIEWKKSDKPRRSLALTYDNPVQLAAYFGAVCNDLNYKHLNVRDALLVIAYTDGSKADYYHLPIDKLREHWAQWLIRLEQFMKTYDSGSEKILKGGKRLFEEDIGNLQ